MTTEHTSMHSEFHSRAVDALGAAADTNSPADIRAAIVAVADAMAWCYRDRFYGFHLSAAIRDLTKALATRDATLRSVMIETAEEDFSEAFKRGVADRVSTSYP